MKSNYNYKFYGDFNSVIKDKYYYGILLMFLVLFAISFSINKFLAILTFIVLIGTIIYVLNKYKSEENLILFTDKNIIHIKNETEIEFDYNDVIKVEYHFPFKHQSYVNLILSNQKLKFTLESKIKSDYKYSNLNELLLDKNKTIEILEFVSFEKYKYFLHEGIVRKVQI
ncbi:hypothetical protein [Flavobacterium sp.]|uniref:hypothetical protein n=1 Tax=Flavobacterium sp. TaxID=239 RepID=UPI0025BA5026|nr:hypothetical protein [Flavobacterium sp.]